MSRRRLLVRTASAWSIAVASLTLTNGTSASAHGPTTESDPTRRSERLAACPVMGLSAFEDSWGDARSGGRHHEGVDMAAQRGTPVVAVRDGEAEFKRSRLGGNAIWLVAPDGDRFYYAHLDAWEGSSRTVRAGEIIGYVGSSGNARGNHLHFEAHLGERSTNPYPLVEAACSTGATRTRI